MLPHHQDEPAALKKYLGNTASVHYQEYLARLDDNYRDYRVHCLDNMGGGKVFYRGTPGGMVSAVYRESRWDSETFGFKVGELEIITAAGRAEVRRLLEKIMAYVGERSTRLVKCRLRYDAFEAVQALEDCGFRLVDAMNIFLWQRDNNRLPEMPKPPGIVIQEEGEPADPDALARIARFAFTRGRINNDPAFSPELTARFYDAFTVSFTGEDKLLVTAGEEGKIIGFASGEVDKDLSRYLRVPLGYLGMIAVSPECAGRGIGSLLLAEFLRRFSRRVGLVEVGTQINNYPALNLYAANGLRMVSSLVTMHRWLD